MAINDLGIVRPGSTILFPFPAYSSDDPSASVIISDFVLADIGIYKGTSMDERGSTTGVVLLDTDGINIDGVTGIHGFTIDLSSNATADFYNVGDQYYVTVGPITIDGATINALVGTFRIGYPGAIHETNIATLSSQTSFTIDAGSADDDAYNGCVVYIHDIASAVQVCFGYVSDYDETSGTLTVTLKADPGIFTIAAGDNISFFPPSNVQAVAGTTQTAGDIVGDWIDGGRLDLLLDAIPTTAMRGTDNAATAASLATLTDALVLTSATIETVTSQTQFVIPATADATDDEAYHGAIAVFIDGTDPNQKSVRLITDYDAGTRTITVVSAPDFTITTSDTLTVLACSSVEAIWDQVLTGATHNIQNSAGKRLRQIEQSTVLASGTIATVTNGHTFTLDSGAVATADFYIGARLQIIEGTGAGQSRIIVGYTSGRVVTLDSDYTTNPDTSSLYEIDVADVHVAVSDADLVEGFVATYTNTTTITLDSAAVATTDFYLGELIVFTHGTGAGQAREITGYTSGRVVTMSPALVTALDTTTTYHIQAAVSVPEIVDEIFDEALSGHTTAGTAGKQIGDMTFTKANELDVNTKSINDAEVIGDGNATPWDGA